MQTELVCAIIYLFNFKHEVASRQNGVFMPKVLGKSKIGENEMLTTTVAIEDPQKSDLNIDEEERFEPKHESKFYEEYIKNFIPNNKKRYFYKFVKRSFDIFASAFALILLSPIMLACAIAVKCDSKGPAIFCQQRVGKDAKPFKFYKFRSMYVTAPRECATSLLAHPEKHITKVGKFLRKTSLDELPQLFCCLVGTMSLIGPRPLVLTERKCNGMREKLGVFEMRPGISGYAQTSGRDDVHYKDKAILDAEYVKSASLWFDFKLILKTASVVLKREGNDAEKLAVFEPKESSKV